MRSSSSEIHRDTLLILMLMLMLMLILILILMIKKTNVAKWHSQELGLSATKSGVPLGVSPDIVSPRQAKIKRERQSKLGLWRLQSGANSVTQQLIDAEVKPFPGPCLFSPQESYRKD